MTLLALNGFDISYSDEGEGDAAILIHGFAASAAENWGRAGWMQMLTRARRRVVTLDLRGHGLSGKSHRAEDYSLGAMAEDVAALSEHLKLKKPDLIGFSLGARVALAALEVHPQRFLLAVLCGVGETLLSPREERDPMALAKAMEGTGEGEGDDMARRFRLFAEAQGQDLASLAACARGFGQEGRSWTRERLGAIGNETLVIAGSGDDLSGAPDALAAAMGNAKARRVPGCGHMDCLTQPMFKAAVMDFLAGEPV